MNLIIENNLLAIPIVGVLVGLLFCFMGKKLLGFIIILFGFLIGYTIGAQFVCDVLNRTIIGSPWIPWVTGLVSAGLSVVAWKISIFFAGTVIGLFAARGILPGIPGIAHGGIALAVGVLVQIYRTPVIAFITALAGGYIAGFSVLAILDQAGFIQTLGLYSENINIGFIIGIALTAIFTIIGYFYQTRELKE
ncbi:MAG: hypothetical protein KAW14_07595 [Candidatus Aegiribacteria sp.]|nr:hypothetical protein [Candidatus Aegiribacteria sp.]